eukprot:scaffold79346_cov43-Cyclotella_meneghiniana.AAC.4
MPAVITQQPTGIRPPPSVNHSPTPPGIRRCARISSRCPPDVSAIAAITIYVAAGFNVSGSQVEERQRNGENVLPEEYSDNYHDMEHIKINWSWSMSNR